MPHGGNMSFPLGSWLLLLLENKPGSYLLLVVHIDWPISFFSQILMLKMISNHTSSHHCKPSESPLLPSQELQMDCNFFLTAIRLASLNQILDPWVYLLLREILLRKFCQVANAVSNCSLEGQKETQKETTPHAAKNPAKENDECKKLASPDPGGSAQAWLQLFIERCLNYDSRMCTINLILIDTGFLYCSVKAEWVQHANTQCF